MGKIRKTPEIYSKPFGLTIRYLPSSKMNARKYLQCSPNIPKYRMVLVKKQEATLDGKTALYCTYKK